MYNSILKVISMSLERGSFSMRVLRQSLFSLSLVASLLAVLVLPGLVQGAEAESEQKQKLTELIQALQKNERLYQNLKLQLTRTNTDELTMFTVPGRERVQQIAEISLVVQGNQFREQIREEGDFVVHSGGLGAISPLMKKSEPNRIKTGTEIWTIVTNGKLCLSFNESRFPNEKKPHEAQGQISDHFPRLPNLARPHMLLQLVPQVPLSISLQGSKAVRSFKGLEEPPPGSSHTTRTQVLDSVEFQGHPCTRVRMELVNTQNETYARYEYWLAEDRNLIPIRLLRFDARDFTALPTSSFLPTSESFVTDWLEVQPGVWYPWKASVKRFDWSLLRSKDQQVLAWRMDYDVHSVELNPELKASEFTQLDFPPGTSVSVWEQGRIVRKYVQGE